ncbi:MAG: DUF1289 domain-containing protein [Methylophilaceae bacterium]|jgi:predicted Fe-S protein YdhL (DUF1289 family)
MMSAENIETPCIGVCTMDDNTGFCLGCYRSLEEIQNWWDMSDEQRAQVMAQLDQRMQDNVQF